jgi:ribosomal protein L11 methyltransferase
VSALVPPDELERARALLLALVPEGFEEVEQGETVELAAYVEPERSVGITASFPGATIDSVVPGWERAWRAFHRGRLVGSLWVGPPWEAPPPDVAAVVVEPGQAFGTGAHPTTRLCLELLQDTSPPSILDAGCGSGVLAIAAARLGCSPVTAIDSDPAALAAARANAEANGVEVAVRQGDVLADDLPTVDTVLANLERRLVEPLAARVQARALIASGYLARERPAPVGWRRRERRELDGWAADLFERQAWVRSRQDETVTSKVSLRSSSAPSPPQPR